MNWNRVYTNPKITYASTKMPTPFILATVLGYTDSMNDMQKPVINLHSSLEFD